MTPSAPTQSGDPSAKTEALHERQLAWRASATMLFVLTTLNAATVILTFSRFDTFFFLSNGLNVILALGLLQTKTWARILTLIRTGLGILLALVPAVQLGATLDLLVGGLLLGGIFLPLIGPPLRVKTLLGSLLFAVGLGLTMFALLNKRVVVG